MKVDRAQGSSLIQKEFMIIIHAEMSQMHHECSDSAASLQLNVECKAQ